MTGQATDSGAGQAGLSRLVGFTDAVVAIAMTLLILPLVNDAGSIGARTPKDFLAENAFDLFAFVLSFVVIFRFWLVHHSMYQRAVGYTPGLVWANLLWLLCLVFLPFPTQLLDTDTQHDALTNGLYIATLVLASASALIQQLIINRTPSIQAPEPGRDSLLGSAAVTALMLAAWVIAVLLPEVGLWSLLLLFLQSPVQRLAGRLHRRRSRGPGVPGRPQS